MPCSLGSMPSLRSRVVTILIPIAVISVAACGSSAQDDTTAATALPWVENDVAALIAESTPSQRPYLEDGTVTPAERERAFLDFLDCMSAEGLTTTEYELRPEGGESVVQEQGSLTDTEVDACRRSRYPAGL